jgi:hypothetical protein
MLQRFISLWVGGMLADRRGRLGAHYNRGRRGNHAGPDVPQDMPFTIQQGRSNIVTATMTDGRLQQTPTAAMTRTNGILVARCDQCRHRLHDFALARQKQARAIGCKRMTPVGMADHSVYT